MIPATQGLLQYLIFNEYEVDLEGFIENFATGHYAILTSDILRLEAALTDDSDLMAWADRANNYISAQTIPAYERFRVCPVDIKRNIDWEVVKTHKENEANGI